MNSLSVTIRAYAELARLSNLPTCFSNAMVGCALGAGGASLEWKTLAGLGAAISFLYVAGVALNDAADAEVDHIERPLRPIPSRRISLRAAYIFVVTAFWAGLGILAVFGTRALGFGLLLAAVIVAYDYLHQGRPWTVFLMGLCRGLIYVVAAVAVTWPIPLLQVVLLATVLTLYTAGFTVVARSENEVELDARRWIAVGLPLLILVPLLEFRPQRWEFVMIAAAMIFWQGRAVRAVFVRPPETKIAVQTWLSGFCLIDAFFLSLLGRPAWAAAAVVCFLGTVLLHRRIMGT